VWPLCKCHLGVRGVITGIRSKAVTASRNSTPCFRAFASALAGSQMNERSTGRQYMATRRRAPIHGAVRRVLALSFLARNDTPRPKALPLHSC
jgi:hypothetical protein